ncbi:nucleotide sugar dehydrogenase [bacterium]|nr:nucleotide sugar dehydrogenase [candidate division CSSED10-310 bacterium]
MKNRLVSRIEDRSARIGVIGLGYVGLPLLIEFSNAGFPVVGFDVDREKLIKLKAGESYIRHIPAQTIHRVFCSDRRSEVTAELAGIRECDAVLICVPTPLTRNRDPDTSYIEKTAREMGPFIRSGQLITLESTTYPGTTDEILVPILEETSDLKAGTDFFVAYSPEREDPNNKTYTTSGIPKVLGGINPDSLETARVLYDTVICRTVPVSDCRTAEATKLVENIFRSVNIALVNELKMVFTEMKIDIWEVIQAASTKPFGYMPFYPGPGLGGHCIPIDPFYLSWKAREYGIPTKFIELAGEINTSMPSYVVRRTALGLNDRGKALKGSRILLVGLAYKQNVDDVRESPTFELWKRLESHGAIVDYFDPYCPHVPKTREYPQFTGVQSREWDRIEAERYDVAIVATAHDCVDHDALIDRVDLVVDTRGVCRNAVNVVRA